MSNTKQAVEFEKLSMAKTATVALAWQGWPMSGSRRIAVEVLEATDSVIRCQYQAEVRGSGPTRPGQPRKFEMREIALSKNGYINETGALAGYGFWTVAD